MLGCVSWKVSFVLQRNLEHTLAGDETDELADAFLHALLGLLCNLGVLGERVLHDSGDWSKVADVSIKLVVPVIVDLASARRSRRLGRRIVRHGGLDETEQVRPRLVPAAWGSTIPRNGPSKDGRVVSSPVYGAEFAGTRRRYSHRRDRKADRREGETYHWLWATTCLALLPRTRR